MRLRSFLLSALAWTLVLSSSPALGAESRNSAPLAPEDSPRPSTAGFYPIWENTGHIEKHREAYIGTNGAHFGIANALHVGVQPIHFLYRTPNVYAKVSLKSTRDWRVSGTVGAYYLLNEASRSFFSPMYTSRLDNPDFAVMMIPATLSATTLISDWLELHQSATWLTLRSTDEYLPTQGYLGYTATAELKARDRHSVLLHVGEIGFWDHDFGNVGASYRYHNTWLEFRLGYFYRFRQDGMQNSPLIGLGLLL